MLPQSKLQDVFFTAFMAFVMVYAMICYNISLNVGGMQNFIFLAAFKEMLCRKTGSEAGFQIRHSGERPYDNDHTCHLINVCVPHVPAYEHGSDNPF